jgi:hypothetical protein
MKTHTTNYFDTFIEIAADSPAGTAEIPPVKGDKKTVANIEYDLVYKHPYQYTSDDVLFEVYAIKHDLTKEERPKAREQFFSKGQPCLRASPLTKRYGWGIHNDHEGKIALVAAGSTAYKKFLTDKKLTVVKAMRSSR